MLEREDKEPESAFQRAADNLLPRIRNLLALLQRPGVSATMKPNLVRRSLAEEVGTLTS